MKNLKFAIKTLQRFDFKERLQLSLALLLYTSLFSYMAYANQSKHIIFIYLFIVLKIFNSLLGIILGYYTFSIIGGKNEL